MNIKLIAKYADGSEEVLSTPPIKSMRAARIVMATYLKEDPSIVRLTPRKVA